MNARLNATNDNKTTLWYELCILIQPQIYIIILEQLSTTLIIDIMTTLYHQEGFRIPWTLFVRMMWDDDLG